MKSLGIRVFLVCFVLYFCLNSINGAEEEKKNLFRERQASDDALGYTNLDEDELLNTQCPRNLELRWQTEVSSSIYATPSAKCSNMSSHHPWKDFPFAGLVTMIGALLALLVDVTAISHVDHGSGNGNGHYKPVGTGEEMKMTSEDRIESGVLASCHKHNSTELVKLRQRLLFTQAIG